MKNLWRLSLIILLTLLMSCKKDDSSQNPIFEKLLGTWKCMHYNDTTGVITNEPAGYSKAIEFDKDGIYKEYMNGNQQEKYKFTLTENPPPNMATYNLLTFYPYDFLNGCQPIFRQFIVIGEQDTIFIFDYSNFSIFSMYIRQ
ncbi:MAG: hypothetical protein ABR968_01100 [Bacteroidales bacterium]|jgi:hypothetical protein